MKYIAKNRKASFEYRFIEKYEAGLVLLGSEVKSLRKGQANISDAFVDYHQGELFLLNSHISEYKGANRFNHEPGRRRKLLMHSKEIRKILGQIKNKGITIVALSLYFNNKNKVKIEIALAEGKKLHDKREAIKEREWNREKSRILKQS